MEYKKRSKLNKKRKSRSTRVVRRKTSSKRRLNRRRSVKRGGGQPLAFEYVRAAQAPDRRAHGRREGERDDVGA